jgi:hypothetical protein
MQMLQQVQLACHLVGGMLSDAGATTIGTDLVLIRPCGLTLCYLMLCMLSFDMAYTEQQTQFCRHSHRVPACTCSKWALSTYTAPFHVGAPGIRVGGVVKILVREGVGHPKETAAQGGVASNSCSQRVAC